LQRAKRLLSARFWIPAITALAALFGIWWIETAPAPLPAELVPKHAGDAERGRLVFAAASCGACHATPGQSDPLRLGGGLALASPFGTFRVPNISSDPIDGIGKWSAIDLARALIVGVSPAGTHYYPAFPYTSYTGMRVEDVEDLHAYLKTLPAVKGRPPPHDLPLLLKVRAFIGIWKRLYFTVGQSGAALNGDPVYDRGAYLTETLGHCAECHATRNHLAAIKPETRFAGGTDSEGTGFVPNITPTRLSAWSEADIAKTLKTGETPRGDRVGSSMADVVSNLAILPQADRDAIARYIKTLPARPTPHP
jgi:mono/diheme cytochrome c family protein